jgi:uncharacterized protein (TIGR02145 family)
MVSLFLVKISEAQMVGTPNLFPKRTEVNLPANITLASTSDYFIASVYDTDYIGYTSPTGPATLDTAVPADGVADTEVNVQGKLTTTGVTIKIPYTVTGSTVNLPAYSQTITIPADYTEDGISRSITFSYPAQSIGVGSGSINATLKSEGGDLNAKKLDIQTGIGNDYLGWLLGQFTYKTKSTGETANFNVRLISGIPDRNFGTTSIQGTGSGASGQYHNFLYLPVIAEDGNVWLNHNLGADYTNLNSASFNPVQKATGIADFNAGGSLFQWGRLSDGHELILNRTTPAAVNGTTTTLATTDVPVNRLFIVNTTAPNDWRSVQNNNLWQGVTGINNPCPVGFRLPTEAEFITLRTAASITDNITAVNSILGLGTTGLRGQDGTNFSSFGTHGNYWTSTVSSTNSMAFRVFSGGNNTSANFRAGGYSVRCIKENGPVATLTLNCEGKTNAGNLSANTAASGVSVTIPYTGGNSGWLAGTSAPSTGVTGLTATYAGSNNIGTSGNLVFNITGTATTTGTANFTVNVGGQTCSFSREVNLPANITLASTSDYFIASVYDTDYIGYTPPTGPATLDTGVPADGVADTEVNVQGKLTTTGVTIKIPYTVTGSTVNLPAYSQTITIPADYTEDGISRSITFSYPAQSLAVGSGSINATLKSEGDDLNAKKLDIQTGIGNDYLGWLLGQFTYKTKSTGETANFNVRLISGIPDRNFGVTSTQGTGAGTSGQFHNFLYLPTVAEDGRIWLNHNLGADYTNLNSVHFNPGQQATSTTDFKAYGSFYQWGRLTDGHELFDWTSSTAGSGKNANTTTLSTTDIPGNRLFILAPSTPNDWRSPQNANLWQGVTGINNPCPQGFRIPTQTEFTALVTAAGITATGTDVKINNSSLKFTFPSLRNTGNTIGNIGPNNASGDGRYWTSTVSGTQARMRVFSAGTTAEFDSYRGHGLSIRCIQETAPPATLTIDCDGKTSAGTLTVGAAASGVTMSIPYTGGNSGWLGGSSATSTGVSGLTATYAGSNNIGTTGNIVFTITGTPASTGTANFSVTVNGVVCAFSLTVNNITIPANITLAQNRRHFIASINDSDYLPYQPATTAATTDTNVAADGTAEATAINVQGTITTTGITVQIPVTASGSGTLPAFFTTVNIPAEFTEDGIARDVTLTWAAQAYTSTTRSITATIAAVGGTLNAKKLDINAGIGNDALGILMGTLTYPYNNAGATTTYQIRDIASIPDRNFGVTSTQGAGAGTSGQFHNFLYLPTVAADGRIWLSHNLGADYTNLNNANFNPAQQATSSTDFRAYGSLYQWGRLTDGHELINWTSGSAGTIVNGTTTTLSATNVPASRAFIINTSTSNFDWRSTKNDNLWQGVLGVNNPCPQGFRLPTSTEFNALIAAENITNYETALISNLNFAQTMFGGSAGTLISANGRYWTSTPTDDPTVRYRNISSTTTSDATAYRGNSNTVRCIQDTTPLATLTIDCDGKTSAGTLSSGVAASGVSMSIPYTGGNSGWLGGSSATSTGVSGLTATYAGSNNIGTTGNIVFTITGTPASTGTANFSVTVNGVVCAFSLTVGPATFE